MCHPTFVSPVLTLHYPPNTYAMIRPKSMDGPVIAGPGGWISIPELSLKKLTTWSIEAACICDRGGVLATELRVATGGRGAS